MILSTSRATVRMVLFTAAVAAAFCVAPLEAQTPPRPAGRGQTPQQPARRPATQKPTTQKPAPPAPAPAAPQAAAPAPAPVPAAQDLRFKTIYTAADQKTESVSYQKGQRQRFEFADMVVLKQNDLKRTVQISRAASSYLVVPDGGPAAPAVQPTPTTPPQTPGVVLVTSTFTDTGERKTLFGLQARRVKTTIERQPMPGACDTTKQRIETDGWYVDVPTPAQAVLAAPPAAPSGCVDDIKATMTGDPKALGFPVSYSTTITGDDGKPSVVSMEVTELEVTTLDASLFDVPAGLTQAGDVRALSRALSDANEAKLAADVTAAAPSAPKTPGVLRIGVTEFTNKTTQTVDTRGLRAQLIGILKEAKVDAEPLPAMPPSELLQRAAERGNDFVLVAEVTELKASKGGAIGGILKKASSVAGGADERPDRSGDFDQAAAAGRQDAPLEQRQGQGRRLRHESRHRPRQVRGHDVHEHDDRAPDDERAQRVDGGQHAGHGHARQSRRSSTCRRRVWAWADGPTWAPGMGMRMGGLDPTAGAASFLMQQAILVDSPADSSGGPSFDAALEEALKNAGKAVSESVKKK